MFLRHPRRPGIHVTPAAAVLALLGLGTTACSIAPDDGSVPVEPLGRAASAVSVQEVVDGNCSTDAVRGLSDQIIEESNCVHEGAFVEIPDRPNLDKGGVEYPYMEAPAVEALVAALDSAPGRAMQINSALRTLPQQYLLYRWYQQSRCGISLAAPPGTSNHESGLAIDIQQYDAWRSTLQSHGFVWQGSVDPWHYDYTGPGAVDLRGTDVLAFQRLWNRNHPEDPIDEDGVYGPQTGSRIAASPVEGFPLGADCGTTPEPTTDGPDVWIGVVSPELSDLYTDGASNAALDTFVGDSFTLVFAATNRGTEPALGVSAVIALPDADVATTDYLIESDAGGAFATDPTNATGPAHGPLGDETTFALGEIAPGETKRITIRALASAYSVDGDEPLAVRAFVANIDDHYTQTSFGGAVTNVDDAQTFGGGRLEVTQNVDVYDRIAFAWDSDRSEGWTNATGPATPKNGALPGDAVSTSAPLDVDLAEQTSVTLVLAAAPGAGKGRLWFSFDGKKLDETSPSVPVDLGGAGGEVVVDLLGPAAGARRLDALRYGPDAAAPAPGLASLTVGSGTATPATPDDPLTDDGGCSCRIDGHETQRGGAALAAFTLALAFVLRRRRP